MHLLVAGAGGQLGRELVRAAPAFGALARPLTRADVDITDRAAVHAAVARAAAAAAAAAAPLVVVNAAAYTAVDRAEQDAPTAYAVNAVAPGHLAAAAAAVTAPLLHVSTDYVFAGDRTGGPPYAEDDTPAPGTVYGRTKLAGEQAVRALHPAGGHVVRTAWVYGRGGNFVRTMARLAQDQPTVDVVADQLGCPTWAADLAAGLLALSGRLGAPQPPPAGVWHWTNDGQASWFELAVATFAALGHDVQRVRPVSSAAVPRPAPRPAYSVLGHQRWLEAGLPPPRPWRAALQRALTDPAAGVVESAATTR